MGIGRYELSDAQWERIRDVLAGRAESVGRTAADNRLFVNGVLWVLRSGAHWHDLPERYGKYKSLHKRFSRRAATGVWEKVFHELLRDRKNQCLMIDSTIVRAHQQAATGRKKRGEDKALGRSRGGLTTKIHLLADEFGPPVDFAATAGQVHDCAQAIALLGGRKAEAVLAGKGYDTDAIVQHVADMGAAALIPPKRNRKQPRAYDKTLYKQRNPRRTMLLQAQTLPPLRHQIRKTQNQLQSPRRTRMRMAPPSAICRYRLSRRLTRSRGSDPQKSDRQHLM